MISGLDHVHIRCGDVERSVKYFEDVFEGKVVSRGESRGFPIIRVDVNGVIINLHGTDPKAGILEVRKGTRGIDHIAFNVKDLGKTAEYMKKKGAKFSTGPEVSPRGVKYAFVEGPDGIRIELLEKP